MVIRVVPAGGLGRWIVRGEGKKLYRVSLVYNLQDPNVHGDLVPGVGEEGNMTSKFDRGRRKCHEQW